MSTVTITPTVNYIIEGDMNAILGDAIAEVARQHVKPVDEVITSIMAVVTHLENMAVFYPSDRAELLHRRINELRAVIYSLSPITVPA